MTRWLRVILALLWTATLLPLLHAFFFQVLLYVGPSPMFLALNLAGIGVLGLLTRGILSDRPLNRWRPPILVSAALAWFAGTALAVDNLIEPAAVPRAVLVAAGGLTSLWQPWLGWMVAWPMARRARFLTAATLFLLAGAFPLLFRTEGVTGADAFIVGWRHAAPAPISPLSEIDSTRPPVDLEPHPDFPQFLGPRRDGTLRDPKIELARSWLEPPPEVLWRRPVGPAWSAFIVVGDRAITQESRGPEEMVVAYDLATGREEWVHRYRAEMAPSMGGPGPRATPTVVDNRVYAVGATGILSCLALDSGTPQWIADLLKDNDARPDDNGVSGSPLVVGDIVVAVPTGSKEVPLAAYALNDGRRRWQARGAPASYSSPILASVGGETHIVTVNGSGLAGYAPDSGRTLWQFPFNANGNNCCQPIADAGKPGRFLVSSDRSGCALLEVAGHPESGWSPTLVWQKPYFRAKFSTPVRSRDAAIGLDMGILARISLADGDLAWKQGRYQFGQILLVGDLLLVLAEDGTLALVDPAANGPIELARFRALEGKTWNHLALAGELLLVRNAREAACLRLPRAAGAIASTPRATTSR